MRPQVPADAHVSEPPARRDKANLAVNPIDAFVGARLRAEGMEFSPSADPSTLLRRLWLDLVGLPPPAAEVESFRNDHSIGACERLVDRLLDNPHFGEKWRGTGSMPPDTRTATVSKRTSRVIHVESIVTGSSTLSTRDLPYDEFIIQQIAGDRAPARHASPDRRDRIPAQLDAQRGGRSRSRAVPDGRNVRPHGLHRQERPRADDPVCAMPQPQIRSDHARRILSGCSRF